ncbi:hypothetical protein BpHYR1_039933 [Brachionus plicatilis]|uniref:Uncharacterized protein n=1 Tax=Brachionus plicatilis TaxID=10195 RepID=A0A3M7QRY4_BRAPC|nr:hypothetical protein BpHYR1_039933 [Brachionus plicatilis]
MLMIRKKEKEDTIRAVSNNVAKVILKSILQILKAMKLKVQNRLNSCFGPLLSPAGHDSMIPELTGAALSQLRRKIECKLPRSNNSLESWHKALAQDIVDHPNFNRLVHHLLKEQNLKDCHSEQIKTGDDEIEYAYLNRYSNKEHFE